MSYYENGCLNCKPVPIKVKYRNLGENERLYDDVAFDGVTKIVRAEYAPKEYIGKGNPYVEAIPAPRNMYQMIFDCQKDKEFHYNEMIHASLSEQLEFLLSIQDLHYILSMQLTLESCFYAALQGSYAHRQILESRSNNVELTIGDAVFKTSRLMVGEASNAAVHGFSLIGPSGCGKTTALHDLLAGLPQVIIHTHEDGSESVQILYIVVNCPARSNFRALYQAIGKAIDRALGNTNAFYENHLTLKKFDNLGAAGIKLQNIIEQLHIGMIILDEFQNMSLDSSSENSMSSLLLLGNETKCVFGVVGTNYSKNILKEDPKNLKCYRRIQPEIRAGDYCQNRETVYNIIRWLFKYQLFTPWINLPTQDALAMAADSDGLITLSEEEQRGKEIMEALYDCSQGIADILISIFTFMNVDAIRNKGSVTVDADYVYTITDAYFSTVHTIVGKMGNDKINLTEEEEKFQQQREKAYMELAQFCEEAQMKEIEINDIHNCIQNSNDSSPDVIISKAVSVIEPIVGSKYNDTTVRKHVKHVVSKLMSNNEPLDVDKVIQLASARILNSRTSDARSDYSPAKAEARIYETDTNNLNEIFAHSESVK